MIMKPVITQHAEEAGFLWLLRSRAVALPHYSLSSLDELDDRVEAHLDGLRIAGDAGWEICTEAMGTGEAGELFAAAVLAFESGDGARIGSVLESVKANPDSFAGLVGALEWLPWQVVEPQVVKLLLDDFPVWRYAALAACAAHAHDPGKPLLDALADPEPLLAARAFTAVGELGKEELLPLLQRSLTLPDDYCRYCAAWSAALLGESCAGVVLASFAQPDLLWHEEAVRMAVRSMGVSSAPAWLDGLALEKDTVRPAIIGSGILGDPARIPWLLEQMAIPGQARIAGEAFSLITGVDIEEERLSGVRSMSVPADDTEREEGESDRDDDLPTPHSDLIAGWWHHHEERFAPGIRYLAGEPIAAGHLRQLLRTGRQRQRGAAAIELALLQPGKPLFSVTAPGLRQRELLGVR